MAENDWMDAKRFDSSRDPYFLPVLSIPKGGGGGGGVVGGGGGGGGEGGGGVL
eukprot:COSAG01_NODE_4339_length_5116_cov_9.801712_4_plen_53_part_00